MGGGVVSGHTPGPWTVGASTEHGIEIEPNVGHVWQRPDARLIAAAPELLGALARLCDVLANIPVPVLAGPDGVASWEAYQDARAAIAKATGGES